MGVGVSVCGCGCECVGVCGCGCVDVWVYWVGMGEWVGGYVCIYVCVHERQGGELHLVKKEEGIEKLMAAYQIRTINLPIFSRPFSSKA